MKKQENVTNLKKKGQTIEMSIQIIKYTGIVSKNIKIIII